MTEVSPYQNPYAKRSQDRLREALAHRIDFEGLDTLVGEESPVLAVGAVDITTDDFRVFDAMDVSADAVVASAALPELFPPVELDDGVYWDGMLSENPPISVLTDADPDEIWVIQLDPQNIDKVPHTLRNIHDRRNDLAGNLSLNQEIRTIEKVNAMIDRGVLDHPDYRHIDIRRLIMDDDFDYPSKLDRSPSFINDLIERGRERATAFLENRD